MPEGAFKDVLETIKNNGWDDLPSTPRVGDLGYFFLNMNFFADFTNEEVYQLIASAADQGSLVVCPASSNACSAVRVVNADGEAVVVGTGCAAEPMCPTFDGTFATGNWSDIFNVRPDVAMVRTPLSVQLAAEDNLYGVAASLAECVKDGLDTLLSNLMVCLDNVYPSQDSVKTSDYTWTIFWGIFTYDFGLDTPLTKTYMDGLLSDLRDSLELYACDSLTFEARGYLGSGFEKLCGNDDVEDLTLRDVFGMVEDLLEPVLCGDLNALSVSLTNLLVSYDSQLTDLSDGESIFELNLYNFGWTTGIVDYLESIQAGNPCYNSGNGKVCSLRSILQNAGNILLEYGQPLLTDESGVATGSLKTLTSKLATYEKIFGSTPQEKTAPVDRGSFATGCCQPNFGETRCDFDADAEVARSDVDLTSLEKTGVSGSPGAPSATAGPAVTAVAAAALAAAALLVTA